MKVVRSCLVMSSEIGARNKNKKGDSVMPLGDNLIRNTTSKKNITSRADKISKASNTNITSNTGKFGMPSLTPNTDTYKTKKMTFYVKEDLLERLYNFAYWDRHSITEAFNNVLEDGLKGKNTKSKQ